MKQCDCKKPVPVIGPKSEPITCHTCEGELRRELSDEWIKGVDEYLVRRPDAGHKLYYWVGK